MKKTHEIEIERAWFQVETLTASQSANAIAAANDHRYTYADIYDAYKHPSEAKVSVWNAWVAWARDVNMFSGTYEVQNLSICDTTCQTFTVCGIIQEYDEDEIYRKLCYLPVATYIMRVTKYHNYLYKLASVEDGEDIELCW